jgi:hypothetical protein
VHFVYSAVLVMLLLMVLSFRQMLVCIDLIERGRIRAPKPNPILFTRDTKAFLDFVLLGRYRSSPDAAVVRSFGSMRAVLFAQLLAFVAMFVYVIALPAG